MTARRKTGFAYLWVMLLVLLLGVGLAAAGTLYRLSAQRDKERELLFIGHQYREAIRRYYEAGGTQASQYPETLEVLLNDTRVPFIRRFLRKQYLDPMTGHADWVLVMSAGRVVGVHSASTNTPLKIGNFDGEDASFLNKQHYSDWLFTYPPGFDPSVPVDAPKPKAVPPRRVAGAG